MQVLPQGYWYRVLYASAVLLLCLLVCLVGSHIYSRAAFLILVVVTISLLSIAISPLALGPRSFIISHQGERNSTLVYNATYTGFSRTTLKNNLGSEFCILVKMGVLVMGGAQRLVKRKVEFLMSVLGVRESCSWEFYRKR